MGDLIKHPNYREPAKPEKADVVDVEYIAYRETCPYCNSEHIEPVAYAEGKKRTVVLNEPSTDWMIQRFVAMTCLRCRWIWPQEALWAYEQRRGGFWRRVVSFFGLG